MVLVSSIFDQVYPLGRVVSAKTKPSVSATAAAAPTATTIFANSSRLNKSNHFSNNNNRQFSSPYGSGYQRFTTQQTDHRKSVLKAGTTGYTPGFYSSIFGIPKKNGGVRPISNLKRLSQYLDAPHFKIETIRAVAQKIKSNDYIDSIDLSDAFLRVGLHQDSKKFLCLKWKKNQVYQYCTTAFGLTSSPYVLTKVYDASCGGESSTATGMAYPFQTVGARSSPTVETSRICIDEYGDNDYCLCLPSGSEDQRRHWTLYSTSTQQATFSISSSYSQPNIADLSSHFCCLSS
ncbi:hypothetical protein G6F42_014735 [Rhizopus arrhizus]|nr:hypothetical protein G6F42_014735 [Rhizopus arrhizus]